VRSMESASATQSSSFERIQTVLRQSFVFSLSL
jgi:hypothetical protein